MRNLATCNIAPSLVGLPVLVFFCFLFLFLFFVFVFCFLAGLGLFVRARNLLGFSCSQYTLTHSSLSPQDSKCRTLFPSKMFAKRSSALPPLLIYQSSRHPARSPVKSPPLRFGLTLCFPVSSSVGKWFSHGTSVSIGPCVELKLLRYFSPGSHG